MTRLFWLTAAILLVSAFLLSARPVNATLAVEGNKTLDQFNDFIFKFNRNYTSAEEYQRRYRIFVDNLKQAADLQVINPHATFGVTLFSDLTDDEYYTFATGNDRSKAPRMSAAEIVKRKQPLHPKSSPAYVDGLAKHHTKDKLKWAALHAKNISNGKRGFIPELPVRELPEAPSSWDWRARGKVTSIKQQGICGSCWSFSATANIESVFAIAGGGLISLSEEEYVACVPGCAGCGGGSYLTAWDWLLTTQGGGMTSNADYPYVSGGGYVPSCPEGPYPIVARITTYGSLPALNEAYMAQYVATYTPISVGVDALSWKSYTGGIMTQCQNSQMDHCVEIVGYDVGNSPPYWIIKNSFGTGWGESGYIRLEYGVNMCLVGEIPATTSIN